MPSLSLLSAPLGAFAKLADRVRETLGTRQPGKEREQKRVAKERAELNEQREFLRRLGNEKVALSDVRQMTRRFPSLLTGHVSRRGTQEIAANSSEGREARFEYPPRKTALNAAAGTQLAPVLDYLIARTNLTIPDELGLTPLMRFLQEGPDAAHLSGLSESSRAALLNTANVAPFSSGSCTALMHAARDGTLSSVKMLIPHSDLEATDRRGCGAFEWALMGRVGDDHITSGELNEMRSRTQSSQPQDSQGRWSCVSELALSASQKVSADFYFALRHNDAATLSALLETHPLLATDRLADGRTPLMRAARWGHTDSLRVLLPYSQPNAQGVDGLSALAHALLCTRPRKASECAELLQPLSNLSVRFAYAAAADWTPLLLAAHRGHAHVVQSLLAVGESGGCDPHAINSDGEDALMLAAARQDARIVSLLLPVSDPHRIKASGDCAFDLLVWPLSINPSYFLNRPNHSMDWSLVDTLARVSPPAAVESLRERIRRTDGDLSMKTVEIMASLERALLQGVVPIETSESIRPRSRRL